MDDYNKEKKEAKDKLQDTYQAGKEKAEGAYNDAKDRAESRVIVKSGVQHQAAFLSD